MTSLVLKSNSKIKIFYTQHKSSNNTSDQEKESEGTSPVAKTPSSQCIGPGFNPWSRNEIPRAATKDLACHK